TRHRHPGFFPPTGATWPLNALAADLVASESPTRHSPGSSPAGNVFIRAIKNGGKVFCCPYWLRERLRARASRYGEQASIVGRSPSGSRGSPMTVRRG